jgi:hypothetical protein
MNEEVLPALLSALGYAVFVRGADGTFTPLAPPPDWFKRLGDVTFPFLGHILEEANDFWRGGTSGFQEWGPCAEVDPNGVEFHYKVIAHNLANRQLLLFQLDTESDHMRGVLSVVRSQSLAAEQSRGAMGMTAMDVRLIREEIQRILGKLLGSGVTEQQTDLLQKLSTRCDELSHGTEKLIR